MAEGVERLAVERLAGAEPDVEILPHHEVAVGGALVGESAAGHPYKGSIGAGEAVRIFTGAPVPEGADAVLLQENATVDGQTIHANGGVHMP